MAERWKAIKGHPGYEVSDLGRVRSLDRIVVRCDGASIFHRGKVLKLRVCSNAYLAVGLGRGEQERVHVLVARAFVRGFRVGREVNHKDLVRSNDHATNREWMTRRENIQHSYDSGARKPHGLTAPMVVGGVKYPSMLAASKAIGVCVGSIASALNKKHLCRGLEVHRG